MSWFQEHAAGLQRAFRWLAVATFILTAIQPILGASGFFRAADDIDYTAIHEMIANLLFLCAVLLLLAAIVAGFQRRSTMITWCAALLVVTSFQIGLGYSTRDDAQLLAVHIPAGVLVFALALMVLLLSYGLTLNREQA